MAEISETTGGEALPVFLDAFLNQDTGNGYVPAIEKSIRSLRKVLAASRDVVAAHDRCRILDGIPHAGHVANLERAAEICLIGFPQAPQILRLVSAENTRKQGDITALVEARLADQAPQLRDEVRHFMVALNGADDSLFLAAAEYYNVLEDHGQLAETFDIIATPLTLIREAQLSLYVAQDFADVATRDILTEAKRLASEPLATNTNLLILEALEQEEIAAGATESLDRWQVRALHSLRCAEASLECLQGIAGSNEDMITARTVSGDPREQRHRKTGLLSSASLRPIQINHPTAQEGIKRIRNVVRRRPNGRATR